MNKYLKFPNNADLNVQDPVTLVVARESKQNFLCCLPFKICKSFLLKLTYGFHISKHQALLYPMGVGLAF